MPVAYEQYAPLDERRSILLFFEVDAATVSGLRSRCRCENITVNSALTAAVLRAVYQEGAEDRYAGLQTAISLRPFCYPVIGNEHSGCFFTMLRTVHRISRKEPFWAFARSCQAEIERERRARRQQGFLPRAFHRAFLAGAMKKNVLDCDQERCFFGGVMLSNVGVADFPSDFGGLKVRSLYFIASQLSGLYQLFLTVHTLYGKLFCCMSCAEPLLSRNSALRIQDSIVSEITKHI